MCWSAIRAVRDVKTERKSLWDRIVRASWTFEFELADASQVATCPRVKAPVLESGFAVADACNAVMDSARSRKSSFSSKATRFGEGMLVVDAVLPMMIVR